MNLPAIVHLDADAFFVSVEQARRPELRGKKCAVGGRERGIIASASYEARACGVYTPMPTVRALRVCPDLILISHAGGRYGEVSRRMFAICESLTPIVERTSIDEGYLDLNPVGYRSIEALIAAARGLQRGIRERIGIPVSLGLATNKLTSQIASKLRKPNGFVVVPPGRERDFLAPLPVGRLPGVGPRAESRLRRAGILTLGDLAEATEERLAPILGSGAMAQQAAARGEDERQVETEREEARSFSQQRTFERDLDAMADVARAARRMLDDLMRRVRADGKRVRTLTVWLRFPDFRHESHGRTLAEGTDLESDFVPYLSPLLQQCRRGRQPVRLVGVRLSGVIDAREGQQELFPAAGERRRRLAGVLDALHDRSGAAVVAPASLLADPDRSRPRRSRKRPTAADSG